MDTEAQLKLKLDDLEFFDEPPIDALVIDYVAQGQRRLWRRRAVTWAGGIAGAAAVATSLAVVLPGERAAAPSGDVASSEVVVPAGAAPRILVDDPNWTITSAYEMSPDRGQLAVSDGEHEDVEISWHDAEQFSYMVEDRRDADENTEESITVLGHEAMLFRNGDTDFETLWPVGEHGFRVRALDVGSYENYLALLGSLREVDLDTWLSAMPDDFVPAPDPEVVADMVADIPLPFEEVPFWLGSDAASTDRRDVAFRVVNDIACDWGRYWVLGAGGVDVSNLRGGYGQLSRDDAVDAFATARDWAILQEMDAAGDEYAETVWKYADAFVSGDDEVNGVPIASREAAVGLQCGVWRK